MGANLLVVSPDLGADAITGCYPLGRGWIGGFLRYVSLNLVRKGYFVRPLRHGIYDEADDRYLTASRRLPFHVRGQVHWVHFNVFQSAPFRRHKPKRIPRSPRRSRRGGGGRRVPNQGFAAPLPEIHVNMLVNSTIETELDSCTLTNATRCCVKSIISDAAIDLAFKAIVELLPRWSFESITMIRLVELDHRFRSVQDGLGEDEFMAVDDAALASPTLRRLLRIFGDRVILVRRQEQSLPDEMASETKCWFQLSCQKPISEILDELKSWSREKVSCPSDPPSAGTKTDRWLTRREIEILDRLSSGDRYCDISGSLGISIDTVRGHLRRLYPKLGVHCRTAAVAVYHEKRLQNHSSMLR